MSNRLHRYYGAGYLHFITTSCYQRRALLGILPDFSTGRLLIAAHTSMGERTGGVKFLGWKTGIKIGGCYRPRCSPFENREE